MVVPLAGSRDAGPGRKWSVDTVADVAVGAAVEWLSSAGPEEKLLTVVLCCAQPSAAKSLLRAIKEVRPVAVGSRGVGGVVAVEAKLVATGKRSQSDKINARVAAAAGKTVGEAKSSVSVTTVDGKRNYRGSDIQYDIQHGFLTLGEPVAAGGAKPVAGRGGGALAELETGAAGRPKLEGPLDAFLAKGTLKRKSEQAGLGGSSAGSWDHERLGGEHKLKSPRLP